MTILSVHRPYLGLRIKTQFYFIHSSFQNSIPYHSFNTSLTQALIVRTRIPPGKLPPPRIILVLAGSARARFISTNTKYIYISFLKWNSLARNTKWSPLRTSMSSWRLLVSFFVYFKVYLIVFSRKDRCRPAFDLWPRHFLWYLLMYPHS